MADQLRDWHDFYILIGTASATLIGLLFVAASVSSSYFTKEREVPLRSLLTPTVLHFSVVLVSCLASIAPSTPASLGALLVAAAVWGIGHCGWVWLRLRPLGMIGRMDLTDRCCYVLIPMALYPVLGATGIVLAMCPPLGLDLMGGTLVAFLLLGIRNAWDMTIWIVLNTER